MACDGGRVGRVEVEVVQEGCRPQQSVRAPEAAVRERRDGGLRAAGHHHVGIAILHEAHRLADGVRAGRARRRDAKVGALRTKLNTR